MSEFIIDLYDRKIWYDLKSDDCDSGNHITFYLPRDNFWIRPHREDGPAIIYSNESKHYYFHGERHREDGPASIYSDGTVDWFLDDEEYSFEDWCEKLDKSDEEINFLRLKWNAV